MASPSARKYLFKLIVIIVIVIFTYNSQIEESNCVLTSSPSNHKNYSRRNHGAVFSNSNKCILIQESIKKFIFWKNSDSDYYILNGFTDLIFVLGRNTHVCKLAWAKNGFMGLIQIYFNIAYYDYGNSSQEFLFTAKDAQMSSSSRQLIIIFVNNKPKEELIMLNEQILTNCTTESTNNNYNIVRFLILDSNNEEFYAHFQTCFTFSFELMGQILEDSVIISKSIVRIKRKLEDQIILKEMFTIELNGDGDIESKGANEIGLKHRLLSEKNILDLKGVELRVAGVGGILQTLSDTNIKYFGNGSIEFKSSFSVDILHALAYMLNFTIIPMLSSTWGQKLNNSNVWNGMIRDVMENDADIGISSTTNHPERASAIDFVFQTSSIPLMAYFRNSGSDSNIKSLLQPFSMDVWVTGMIWILVCALYLVMLKYIHNVYINNLDFGYFNTISSTLDYLIYLANTFCLRGFSLHRQTLNALSTGIVCCCALWLAIILNYIYGANLYYFISKFHDKVQTLEQLEGTGYRVSILGIGISATKLLSSSDQPSIEKLIHRASSFESWDRNAIKEYVMQGSSIIITFGIDLTPNTTIQEQCQLKYIPLIQSEPIESPIVAKGSQLKRLIDAGIIRLYESGLLRKWQKQYLPKKPICADYNELRAIQPIPLTSIWLVIWILGIGFLVSIIGIIIEYKLHHGNKNKVFESQIKMNSSNLKNI